LDTHEGADYSSNAWENAIQPEANITPRLLDSVYLRASAKSIVFYLMIDLLVSLELPIQIERY
jgi:hypothetical protein